MLDPLLRRVKDAVLAPVAERLPAGLDPTVVSLLGFLVGLGAAALAARQAYAAALALWLLNRTMDGLDGVFARRRGRQSDLGGYLDILLDFVIYAAIPIALAVGRPASASLLLALALLLASFYLNAASWMYLAALLEKRAAHPGARATSVVMPTGLIEGTETIVLFSLFLLLPDRLATLYALMAALVIASAAQRVVWAIRHL